MRSAPCLAFATAAVVSIAPAAAQTQTEVLVHVERSVPNPIVSINFPESNPIQFRGPIAQRSDYRTYRQVITWPLGNRPGRSDFQLYAKVDAGPSNTYYLRLNGRTTQTNIYVFRYRYTECERQNLSAPSAPEDIFRQLAIAEAMLTVPNPTRRCSSSNLQHWTNLWIDRVNRLWQQNQFLRLNPAVISAIRGSYQARRLQLPEELGKIVDRDRQLSAVFAR